MLHSSTLDAAPHIAGGGRIDGFAFDQVVDRLLKIFLLRGGSTSHIVVDSAFVNEFQILVEQEHVRGGACPERIGHDIARIQHIGTGIPLLLVTGLHVREAFTAVALGLIAVHQHHAHAHALAESAQFGIAAFPSFAAFTTHHEGAGVGGENDQETIIAHGILQRDLLATDLLHLLVGCGHWRADGEVREWIVRK